MDEDKKEMGKVPYASLVGSVTYTMICTRSDITHVVGVVSRFMSNPRREHREVVKWLIHYLKVLSKLHYVSKEEILLWKAFLMHMWVASWIQGKAL